MYWRRSCTDPTWKSPACTKLFVNNTLDAQITPCYDGSWCSSNGSDPIAQACCATGGGFFIASDGTQTSVKSMNTEESSATIATSKQTASSASATPTDLSGGLLRSPKVIFCYITEDHNYRSGSWSGRRSAHPRRSCCISHVSFSGEPAAPRFKGRKRTVIWTE